jgi:hypothetical protein
VTLDSAGLVLAAVLLLCVLGYGCYLLGYAEGRRER